MKTLHFLLALAAGIGAPHLAHAQSDTAHHRAIYSQINQQEKSLQRVTGTHRDDPLVFELTGWMEKGVLRKIVAKSNEDGAGAEEYYLENEKPLFVYSTYLRNHLSATPLRIENRLYFKEGEIFKWLTNDKDASVLHGEDYAAEGERLTANCAAFVAALKKNGPAKTAAAAQVTVGIFAGIEEGDYAHWNMRTAAGKELSLFVLRPDASVEKVLENPKAFAGRKCKVTWKESTEDIPEAGGKMKVQQILSVEWTGGK